MTAWTPSRVDVNLRGREREPEKQEEKLRVTGSKKRGIIVESNKNQTEIGKIGGSREGKERDVGAILTSARS